MENVIFEGTNFIVCAHSNSGKGKVENTFYQCEYEWRKRVSENLLSSVILCDNFLIFKLFLQDFFIRLSVRNSLDNNLLQNNNKKNLQYVPCCNALTV